MTREMAKKLVEQMTLEEKTGMCSGKDFWHLKSVERLGIPSVMVCDGPNGLRKQVEDQEANINDSIQSVCFPSSCATAASFDRDLMYKAGQAMGNACQAENISVLLGPGANIKRSPLCGRNFEYYSEDPYLSGQIAAAHIKGVQSKGVGSSLKHFAANNQETRRMSVNAIIDERTLREIYLASFEEAVKEAQPWTVMCSYNRVNGCFSSENTYLLTDVLKKEWGFDGYVVSDWGAVNDRVDGLRAGLDLEMPGTGGYSDAKILEAVKNGVLEETQLNDTCERIISRVMTYCENRDNNAVWNKEEDHQLAIEIARECIVLLKNDNHILPLNTKDDIAFIGFFAEQPRFQGGGSAHIQNFRITSALEAVEGTANVTYAKGYETKQDVVDEKLIAEAVLKAKQAKVAVIFAGLPDEFESEGFDRKHMDMPKCQLALIDAVTDVQPNTIVVLHNGSPIQMPWLPKVKGVIEAYLGGQGIGAAVVDILFGRTNPCGKLAETFPIKLEDAPCYLNFPGEGSVVDYREGIFVGYRYYDKKNMNVLFPFGFGLSYTDFEYSDLQLNSQEIWDDELLKISVKITNTGKIAGKEIVQFYVKDVESSVIRPMKELKQFAKVELQPGESKRVEVTLDGRAFSYYDTDIKDWVVEKGDFEIMAAKSSRDICCSTIVHVTPRYKVKRQYDLNSVLEDIYKCEEVRPEIQRFMDICNRLMIGDGESAESLGASTILMMENQTKEMPLRGLVSFSAGEVTTEELMKLLEKANA